MMVRPSAAAMNSPPNLRISRAAILESSAASVTSVQSSTWSVEQPVASGGAGLLTDPALAYRPSELSPQPPRIRDKYGIPPQPAVSPQRESRLSSRAAAAGARASAQLARGSEAAPDPRQSAVAARCSVAFARAPAEPKSWLQEHNEKRVSYYEPTIFALQQAGIHVEPHWFGPVQCAPPHRPS
jgi:hypothetical protein